MKVNFNNLPTVSRANRSIGAILMDAGLLSPEDAERILLLQKEKTSALATRPSLWAY